MKGSVLYLIILITSIVLGFVALLLDQEGFTYLMGILAFISLISMSDEIENEK